MATLHLQLPKQLIVVIFVVEQRFKIEVNVLFQFLEKITGFSKSSLTVINCEIIFQSENAETISQSNKLLA